MTHPLLRMVPALEPQAAALAVAYAAAPDAPELARVPEVLREEAERYLIAGGAWTASDWRGMADVERVAATAAGERVWLRRAVLVVEALGAGEGAAGLRATLDGGESLVDLALDMAAGAAISRAAASQGQARVMEVPL